MEELSGYIEHIIYFNKQNGYTVFELDTDTGMQTCVGILHGISEGEKVALKGEFVNHASYGEQFSIKEYSVIEATDEESIRRYLSSGAIKGIGPALADRIIRMFGEDTFRIMEEEPELLSRVKGISTRKAQEIAANVMEKRDLRQVMVFLQKYGISNNLSMKIFERYGMDILSIIKENPYKIAEDIDGVGFKTADEIARISGIALDSVYRIQSGILYTLSMGIAEGHTYLPKGILLSKSGTILDVDADDIWIQVENLSIDKRLIIKQFEDEIRIYSNAFYYMEINCAGLLSDIDVLLENDTDGIRKAVLRQNTDDTEVDDLQIEAVVTAVTHGVCIITGGPGTGKTTTINKIIRYLETKGEDFLLAAPTGRAAKRMTEATGYEASTIQRMLGLGVSQNADRGYYYDRNEENPLDADTIIVDEMSMVDLPVFTALLKAVMPGTRLVMVGDINQLPSVGPGSVLKDIIASECFPVVKLERIFRQAGRSEIIINAHKINNGTVPVVDNKGKDFFLLQRDDVNVITKIVVQLIAEKMPKYVNASVNEIQVLTPMRRGPLGVESLNPILQNYLNPPSYSKQEKEYGNTLFREGDKVMQIRNNYQLEWEVQGKYGIPVDQGLGVFNGDMGTIIKIDTFSEVCEVLYEENHLIRYPFSNLDELELAYAVTIHKSQGSEYPAVVIPLLSGPRQLFNRNLLYTAVTRAKKCVTIVGSRDTFEQMINNADENKRYTGLKDCIRERVMNW